MKKIADKLAFLVSAIFSPFLVIPLFSLFTIRYYSPSLSLFLLLSLIFVGFSVIMPFLYVILAVKFGLLTDIHVALKEQRKAPFEVAIVGSLIILVTYFVMHVPYELLVMSLALVINGLVFVILTKYLKASMHAASFASAVTIVGILISPIVFWCYLLLIPIFWARINRKKHTFLQLISAAIISSLLTASVLLVLK